MSENEKDVAVLDKPFEDIKINDVKALFPQVTQTPLFSPMLDNANPGMKLIQNDGDLWTMLKIVYIEDFNQADKYAAALCECSRFLLDREGKPRPMIQERINWIKIKLALKCSVKGRFADSLKQIATGVLTNAMSDDGGWTTIMPIAKSGRETEQYNTDHQPPGNNGKKRSRP